MNTEQAKSMTRLLNIRSGLALGLLLGILVTPPVVLAASGSTLADRCGATSKNVPSEVVALASAKDIWLEFPAMMRAPMLETDAPAMLMVFSSGYDPSAVSAGNPEFAAPTSAGLVLCVAVDTGYIGLFTNVDATGSRLAQ